MAKLTLKKAATDVSVYLFAQDSSKTTGVGLAGLAYNTASLTAYYVRPLGSATAITLATQTVTGAHSDGGFVEVDATNMPGVYRLDLPDAVCATGVPSAVVMLKGATNLAPIVLEIQLTDFDLNTAFTSALVADAVLDEATSGHTSAGSFSKAVTDILADTGTDGVVVASLATDSITADALKADAVTEIQNGLALEATLTAIKGNGWTNETLEKIWTDINAIEGEGGLNLTNLRDEIIGVDPETLTSLMTAITALATATDLATVDTVVDAIKAKTDLIPASPAEAGEYTTAIAAVKSVADDILEDTGTTLPATLATLAGYTDGIAGDVWSHPTRTLTVPAVAAAATEDGTTLTLYKDADINIEFTGLTIPTGAKKVVFTIKDNLDDADTASALQATYQLTDVPAETHTLNYINSAVPPVLTTPVTFTVDTDSVEFDMTAAAAYYLPRYERGYLHWDLKLITATTVQILQQGLVQILGTSTRTVA